MRTKDGSPLIGDYGLVIASLLMVFLPMSSTVLAEHAQSNAQPGSKASQSTPAAVPAARAELDFSGSLRLRAENWQWFRKAEIRFTGS